VLFVIVGLGQMAIWAEGKEKRYRLYFGDKYKPKKYPLIPGIPYSQAEKAQRNDRPKLRSLQNVSPS
jgi:hypothetical protein